MQENLTHLLNEYLGNSKTTVAITNYPFPGELPCGLLLFLLSPSGFVVCRQVNRDIMPLLKDAYIGRVNEVINRASRASLDGSRVVVVDINKQFEAHGYYSGNSWFAGTRASFFSSRVPIPYGVHPNEQGQSCIAAAIWEAVKKRFGSLEAVMTDPCP